jgi:histone-lysine N-methyltransferase SETD2
MEEKFMSYFSKNILRLDRQVFADVSVARAACDEAARKDCIALVTYSNHSKKHVYLKCVCHGISRNTRNLKDDERKRKTWTVKCNCPLRISINPYYNQYKVLVLNGEHNHEKAVVPSIFHQNRRLNEEQYGKFRSLAASNLSSDQILQVMRNEGEHTDITRQDAANIKLRIRNETLDGKSEFQLLVESVGKLGWECFTRVGLNNVITGFLFIPFISMLLLKLFGVVIVIDATYKTNKNKYPLVEGVGITNTWSTFNAFYCFLSSETENDYVWLMERLQRLLGSSFSPIAWATDRDLGLINSIRKVFPHSKIVLCTCMFFFFFFFSTLF